MEDNILNTTEGFTILEFMVLEKNIELGLNLLDKLDEERIEYRKKNGYDSWKYDSIFKCGEYVSSSYRNLLKSITYFNLIAASVNNSMLLGNVIDVEIQLEALRIFLFESEMDFYKTRVRLKNQTQWLQIDITYKKVLVSKLDDMFKLYNSVYMWTKEQHHISEKILASQKHSATIRSRWVE